MSTFIKILVVLELILVLEFPSVYLTNAFSTDEKIKICWMFLFDFVEYIEWLFRPSRNDLIRKLTISSFYIPVFWLLGCLVLLLPARRWHSSEFLFLMALQGQTLFVIYSVTYIVMELSSIAYFFPEDLYERTPYWWLNALVHVVVIILLVQQHRRDQLFRSSRDTSSSESMEDLSSGLDPDQERKLPVNVWRGKTEKIFPCRVTTSDVYRTSSVSPALFIWASTWGTILFATYFAEASIDFLYLFPFLFQGILPTYYVIRDAHNLIHLRTVTFLVWSTVGALMFAIILFPRWKKEVALGIGEPHSSEEVDGLDGSDGVGKPRFWKRFIKLSLPYVLYSYYVTQSVDVPGLLVDQIILDLVMMTDPQEQYDVPVTFLGHLLGPFFVRGIPGVIIYLISLFDCLFIPSIPNLVRLFVSFFLAFIATCCWYW